MPKTPRIPLGLKGLNTDIPSHSLPLDFFNAGTNVRSFNGALQGVNSFVADSSLGDFSVTSESASVVGIYDAAQFTPAGSEYFNVIALVKHNDNSFKFKAYSSDSNTATVQVAVSDYTLTLSAAKSLSKNETLTQATSNATAKVKYKTTNSTTVRLYDITGTWTIGSQNITASFTGDLSAHPTQIEDHINSVVVTSGTFDHDSTSNSQTITIGYNPEFGSDMFVFNETLVINTVKSKPLYLAAQGSKISVIDNWPADVDVGLLTFDNSEFIFGAIAVQASPTVSISPGSTISIGSTPLNTGSLTVPPPGGSSPTSITNNVPLHVIWLGTSASNIDTGYFQVIGTSDGSTSLTSTPVHFGPRMTTAITPEKFKTITGIKFSNNSNMDSSGSAIEIDHYNISLGHLTSQKEKLFTPKIAQFGGRLVALGLFGEGVNHFVGTFTTTPSNTANHFDGGFPTNTTVQTNEGLYNERASVIFSSPITEIGSLAGIEWTVASTNSTVDDIITESPGAVVDGGQLGDNFIVYKSDCVLSYREITSSPYILGRVIQTDDGMISSRCFADIGNNSHIVFGNHGIYIHNGENQKQNVSKNKIQDALYAEINMSKKGQCFVFRNEQDKETYFCIPTTNHTTEGCDKAYVYAEETDSWYTRELGDSHSSSNLTGVSHIFSTELNGIVKNVACKTATTYNAPIFGNSGQLHKLDTTAFVSGGDVQFLNNPLETSAINKTVTTAYPMCNGAVKIGLTSTDNIGDSASVTTKDFNPANDYKLSFRETGRYFDMKIEMNSTTNPEVTAMEFDVIPRGKR